MIKNKINVPGQMGPNYSLSFNKEACDSLLALKAILQTQGASNLIGELHRLMNAKKVNNPVELFGPLKGLILDPKSIIESFKSSVECGQAENYTYHFAMTAIALSMELEKIDPEFFKTYKSKYHNKEYKSEVEAYVKSKVEAK